MAGREGSLMRGRFRILIVDDEDNILRAISRMLQDYAADTDTALDNNQALNRFKQIPYDLAILDMNMPDFDGVPNNLAGIKLLERLRKIDAALPTVILTGEDEATVRTMLKAKNLEHIDVFLKDKSSGSDLCQKIDDLINESEISLLAAGETSPVYFKRKDIVNLQGVVSKVELNGEAQVFIVEQESISPNLINRHWLATTGYGKLREEPVDIIGVRNNKFVVVSSSDIVFLRDFYRNKILVHRKDLEGLAGLVVEVNENMKRNGVRIISTSAPQYLTSKKYWQAVADDNSLLPMSTEVDILGERDNKLRIRASQTLINTEKGQKVEITKASLLKLLGKVVKLVDEDDRGSIQIISQEAPEDLSEARWQATAEDENIFIPGEKVEVIGVKNKKLLVREHMMED